MGSIVAHEVALRLQTKYGVRPLRLFVSGSEAPHLRSRLEPQPDDDAAFLEQLRELGHSSLAAIEDPVLFELVLPSIRSDYRLCAEYQPLIDPPKHRAPLVAYRGADDADCRTDDLAAWSRYTCATFEMRVFPGDHFYLQNQEQQLLAHISGHLRSDLRLHRVTAGGRAACPDPS
jgi:pyochelin biosynthetic protein PchC